MTFFVIRSDFVIFPYLQKRYISLRFREIFYSFTVLQNLPLISLHLPVLTCFTCFSFPLLYHDAFMHHTMHVLDVPRRTSLPTAITPKHLDVLDIS